MGYNPVSGCNAQRLTEEILSISHPSLCVNCYRVEEAFICEQFDKEKELLRDNAKGAMEALEHAIEVHAVKLGECKDEEARRVETRRYTQEFDEMKDFVGDCYSEVQDLEDEKKVELRRFRDEQGVWGDG